MSANNTLRTFLGNSVKFLIAAALLAANVVSVTMASSTARTPSTAGAPNPFDPFFFSVAAEGPGAPAAPAPSAANQSTATSCGGPGERACCIYDKSFPDITPACNSGLTEQGSCTSNCGCGTPGGPASDVFFSVGICTAPPPPPSSCGGPFERACCVLENGVDTQACDTGSTVKVLGCDGDCECSLFGVRDGVNAIETCYPKECGGKGQRACTVGERLLEPCDSGLTEIPGCAGDCSSFDKLLGSKGVGSSSMCADMSEYGHIPEPTTNRIINYANSCSMSGYADLHLHLFAETAHGGGVLAGMAYDPNGGGVNVALQQDYGTTKDMVDFNGVDQAPMFACPYGLASCGTTFFHKDHLLDDPVGSVGTNDGAGSNLGAPIFNGWPKWTSTTHQQAYYQWVKRAFEGGMRLTTMLAVTNSALCKGNKRVDGTNCDDSMAQIDVQLQAAKDFEQWIAAHDGGWFEIAYTPLDARKIIGRGHLAVVLGIEVEHLFNCSFPSNQVTTVGGFTGIVDSWNFNSTTTPRLGDPASTTCTPALIEAELDHYYQMGVRHVFPVHNFDNAFAAPATWMSGIEFGNRVIEKHWWVTENCPAEPQGNYGFKSVVGSFGNWASFFSRFIFDFIPTEMIAVDSVVRHDLSTTCNSWGVLPLGEVLLQGLMDRGMIIDVDHMSRKSLERTLDLTGPLRTNANPPKPAYPVTATHVLSFDMHSESYRHERMRTADQLQRISSQGGMIAAMLKDDVQDTGKQHDKATVPYTGVLSPGGFPPAPPVADDCQQSSKSWAQAYMYDVDHMGNKPVAFGSDFNGIAAHVGPRFGSDGCGGDELIVAPARQAQRDAQYFTFGRQKVMNNPLNYPINIPGFGLFNQQVTGQRTFDFNVDGMAHIGMLPDFVAELQTVGLPQPYVDKIFQSAEEYIKMWERATAASPRTDDDTPLAAQTNTCEFLRDTTRPTVVPHVTPAPNAAGWHHTPPTVSFTVTDDGEIASTSNCDTQTIITDTSMLAITCTATDANGNVGTGTATIKLDQVQPTVSFGAANPPANANGWQRSNVTMPYTLSDDRSGVSGSPTGSLSFTVDGAGMTRAVIVTDIAGNSRTLISPAVSIDRVAPTIARGRSPLANAFGWSKTPVTVSFSCADALSGVDFCQPSSTVDTEGANQSRTGTVTDRAGNTASTSLGSINIDMTPPTIVGSRSPLANVNGWNNVPVTASFSCADALSGVDTCPPASTVSTEGANQARPGQVFDRAGNSAVTTVDGINLDFTPPTIAGSRLPLANVHGWNNVPVTASFACNDTLSGVDTCTAPSTVGTEGANQSRAGQVFDKAGNSANTTVNGISIDLTPPTIAGSRAPLANSYGWNNVPVTVSFACNDGLSGLESCTAPSTLNTEGANQSRSGQAVDNAGNTAGSTVGSISLDFTPPTIAGSRLPLANAAGWNNTDVTVTFVCGDALSGLVTCDPTPQIVSVEGANLSRTAGAADKAGNTASATVGGINLDKTPPVVGCTNGSPMLWPPNHKMWDITAGVTVDGGLSGSAGFVMLNATSSEPDNGLGDGDTANDIQGFTFGSADVTGQLRAERSGTGSGRVYSLLFRGADVAGNTTQCTTTVAVPHDQSKQQ